MLACGTSQGNKDRSKCSVIPVVSYPLATYGSANSPVVQGSNGVIGLGLAVVILLRLSGTPAFPGPMTRRLHAVCGKHLRRNQTPPYPSCTPRAYSPAQLTAGEISALSMTWMTWSDGHGALYTLATFHGRKPCSSPSSCSMGSCAATMF